MTKSPKWKEVDLLPGATPERELWTAEIGPKKREQRKESHALLHVEPCSPARRKAKSTQHLLTKRVVAVSDYWPHRTEDLLSTQVPHKDAVGNFGHLRNEQEGVCPAKHLETSKQVSSKSSDNQLDGKSSKVSASPVTYIRVKQAAATEPATVDSAFAEDYRRHSRKNKACDLSFASEADASLPLTGSHLCGTPGILRKMWMKHRKKSEYLGATNCAFEAD